MRAAQELDFAVSSAQCRSRTSRIGIWTEGFIAVHGAPCEALWAKNRRAWRGGPLEACTRSNENLPARPRTAQASSQASPAGPGRPHRASSHVRDREVDPADRSDHERWRGHCDRGKATFGKRGSRSVACRTMRARERSRVFAKRSHREWPRRQAKRRIRRIATFADLLKFSA